MDCRTSVPSLTSSQLLSDQLSSIGSFLLDKGEAGITNEVNSTLVIIIAVTATLLLGWLASKRIAVIKRVINTDSEVKGRIQSIIFNKANCRVEFEYTCDGQTYQAGNVIWKSEAITQLQNGDEIILIVDPEKPSRAIIASLYI